jgi:hypothetical protein
MDLRSMLLWESLSFDLVLCQSKQITILILAGPALRVGQLGLCVRA